MGHTFNNLSISNQVLLLEDMGIELLSIEYYDHRIHLYSFQSLFIEAYHNIETKEIERIAVCEMPDLDKYLSRIILPLHQWNTKRSSQQDFKSF